MPHSLPATVTAKAKTVPTYFHVYILLKQPRNESVTKLGMSEGDLITRVIEPYEHGRSIVLNGRTIDATNILSLRVSRSEATAEQLLRQAEAEQSSSRVAVIASGFTEYLAWSKGVEVTDSYVVGPAGHKSIMSGSSVKSKPSLGNRVFVVHGKDHGLKNAVARFLQALGLDPIILHEKPDGGRTVIDKFEDEAQVSFAVILATADDPPPASPGATHATTTATRARPNVLFELGFFRGVLGAARTALVKDPDVDLPSDLAGVIYLSRANWGSELHGALVDAGYAFGSQQVRDALAIRS